MASAWKSGVALVMTYDTVELCSFVALWLAAVVLGFSSAELTEVLSSSGDDILEQLHLDAPKLLS